MAQKNLTGASTDSADRVRPNFIDTLVAELTSVSPAASWLPVTFAWCLGSWLLVALLLWLIEPMRDGALAGLSESPRFAIELALGHLAGLAAIWAGLEIGVPGAPRAWRLWTPPLVLFAGWLLTVVYGAVGAIDPPSMVGKRAHCFTQAIVVVNYPAHCSISPSQETTDVRNTSRRWTDRRGRGVHSRCLDAACLHGRFTARTSISSVTHSLNGWVRLALRRPAASPQLADRSTPAPRRVPIFAATLPSKSCAT